MKFGAWHMRLGEWIDSIH